MIPQTYDPILKYRKGVTPYLGGPRRPEPGTALVLERRDGTLDVVLPGERPAAATLRRGGYRASYLIDMSSHELALAVAAPSADGWSFNVTLRFTCRVVDPRLIARVRYRDMARAVRQWMNDAIRGVTVARKAVELAQVESDIRALLRRAKSPDGLELSSFFVSVSVMDSEDLVAARRAVAIEEMNRAARRAVAAGTREDMLAHMMAINGGDPTAFLKFEREMQEQEDKARLEATRLVLESGTLSAAESAYVSGLLLNQAMPWSSRTLRSGRIRDQIRNTLPGSVHNGLPAIEAADSPAKQDDDSGGQRPYDAHG